VTWNPRKLVRYLSSPSPLILLIFTIFSQAYTRISIHEFSEDYSWITSTKSPSFCMTNFSASLTQVTVFLYQSRDCCCYLIRPILAPPPLWLQKHTDLWAQDFAQPHALWHRPRTASVTRTRSSETLWN